MPHIKVVSGNKFVTPRISKPGKDGKPVFLNDLPTNGASALALNIGYIMEVIAHTSEKDNRYENKTAREAGKDAINAGLADGKPEDVLTYWLPDGLNDAGELATEWVPVMSAPRKDLIACANLLVKADSIIAPAEAELKKIATGSGIKLAKDPEYPTYATGTGGRAKRAGGITKIDF